MGQHGGKNSQDKFAINVSVLQSLASGSISSTITTIVYQPLELLKTRIQIQNNTNNVPPSTKPNRVLGRATQSAIHLVRERGLKYLWRGTGASLLRSGPGVGLYYALLNIMQTNFSNQNSRPDNPTQALYFGLTARSVVSFVLLPITVVKVRYESGKFTYPSLGHALRHAYLKSGWVGIAPTILRDSLFSGIYYMCYTKLKSSSQSNEVKTLAHSKSFANGVLSGLVASVVTNPIDVLKTNIQVTEKGGNASIKHVATIILKGGYARLFDGLVPRSLRRTLIAATTWTFYELIMDSFRR